MSAVHWVMARTKTRSKKSSSGITRSSPRITALMRGPRSSVAVVMASSLHSPPLRSDAVISTNQFKNGAHVEIDGAIYRILEFQHVKPGKGGAFVRTKLRKLNDSSVQDKTFRAGEQFRPVRTEARRMQYLYDSRDAGLFLASSAYELPGIGS